MSPASNALLRDRANMFGKVRHFFDERGIMEVDTPLLSPSAPIDAYSDPFEVHISSRRVESTQPIHYLHPSPEYGMKSLLSRGSGEIYQLSHVYRKGEYGNLHNPIFTLIEWYRIETSYEVFFREVLDLLALFLPDLPHERLSYCAAFKQLLDIDPYNASVPLLIETGRRYDLDLDEKPRDLLLNELWGCLIAPHLGKGAWTSIDDYPPSQAALAQITRKAGRLVAERFEIYHRGVELGNGYHELTDAAEQKKRWERENGIRTSLGKARLPIDEELLSTWAKGLPDCYGIAIGFDRLMMLRHNCKSIGEVLPAGCHAPNGICRT